MAKNDSKKSKKKSPSPIGTFCFVDRELSWLQFNLRVLKEANDKTVPLLERLKFLSIYFSNLDEFYMVRFGSLVHREELFPDYKDEKTGYNTSTQLKKINSTVRKQQVKAEEIYSKLIKDMSSSGIEIVDFNKASKVEESMAKKFFNELRPMINPIIVDGAHPLPFLQNKEVYTAVMLGKGDNTALGLVATDRLPKYHVFELKGIQKVIYVPDLVAHFAPNIFKKYDVRETCSIRVTRNADVFLDEHLAQYDFKASMQKLLRKRKRELPVRLQVIGTPSTKMLNLIGEKIDVNTKSTFVSTIPTSLGFGSLLSKTSEMVYDDRKPVKNVGLKRGQYINYLQKNDLLLSFPFQSFSPLIDLIYEAAEDPDVTSIKITLYRLSSTSKLAAALAYAADLGKDVLCLLELRARFDEQNNIDYSEMLESAGCRVIYGLQDMKVHSKVCLITRNKGGNISYITQVGTGNYNEITSELYTDLSFFTSKQEVGAAANDFFDALSLGDEPSSREGLLLSPYDFKPWLLEMLESERTKGTEGKVTIKVNSLNDIDVMKKLIECSQAGVKIELFIRGICCLKPGLIDYTENITVKSVVGRYLEHSRIYMFGKEPNEVIYIGSGDLLNRNTQRRVEAFVEITSDEHKSQIREIIGAFRKDNKKGSTMLPDGRYTKKGDDSYSSQDELSKYFANKRIESSNSKISILQKIKSLFKK